MGALKRMVDRVLGAYPRVYFACHARHRRDPATSEVLSERQASILDHLDGARPTGVSELAEHFGVTPATMSVTVARLVRDGYVKRRTASDDKRRAELRLTSAGERMKAAMQVLEPGLVEAVLRELAPAERRRAIEGLELLARAADASYHRRKET
jgi:DNA-binding MarR family transcriptional regulator